MGAVGLAAPATASLTGPGVGAGRNITVFHNIDMVAAYGFGDPGEQITIDVVRGGVRIGSATGPLVASDDGPGLEVNHEGTGAPGDCWENTTPDIRPGDKIQVRSGADVDEITVDDLRFTDGPFEGANGEVVLHGIAKRYDGTPIPASLLDTAEFRDDAGTYRTGPDVVEARPGVAGGFTVRYQTPYLNEDGRNRNNLTVAQQKAALLTTRGGHSIGFGHTEPTPPESQIVEGVDDASGPGLGCEGSPAGENPPPPPPPPPGDTVAPTVTNRAPAVDARSVARGANVTATFSEAVDGVTASFKLRAAGATGDVGAVVARNGTTDQWILNPNVTLAPDTRYTATLGGGIQDAAGNALTAVSWSFTTGPAPRLTARTPAPAATGVRRAPDITATFSEALAPASVVYGGTRTVQLRNTSTNAVITAVASFSGTTLRINPSANLASNTQYTVRLTNGLTDLVGNRFAGATWNFRTGTVL